MPGFRRLLHDFGGIAFVLALLVAVTFLPPDTSLSEVRATATLKACVPPIYPPLVTGEPERPGIDIELLRAVAGRLGVSLALSENQAMGRDFNPRNWGLNRAQCQVIAGGVVDSDQTRSFLETGPSYAGTGWAIVAPASLEDINGLSIGVLTNISGLDRISLSNYLRRHEVAVRVMRNGQQLVDGIAGGELDGGVTEAMLASGIAADNGWWVDYLPEELTRYNLVFGLWKGDLTLKWKIVEAMRQLESDGTIAAILERYGVAPLGWDGSGPAR